MTNFTDGLSDSEILALTIIGEARGEPIEGQVAVGCIIRNRMRATGKSYRDVCLAPKQFSCWNETDPNYQVLKDFANKFIFNNYIPDPEIKQCIYIAKGIEDWFIVDNTGGSKNYVTESLWTSNDRPSWTRNPIGVPKRIGNQVFFNV